MLHVKANLLLFGVTHYLVAQDATGIESAKEEAFNADNLIPTEQEERRMSDLSDFNWSVTSSVDFQVMNSQTFRYTYR